MPIINIIESETKGLSPLDKNFSLAKYGNFTTAILKVHFTESFGYALKKVFLNGVEYKAQNGSYLEADVKNILKNGDNKLTVSFDALQIFGAPLGQATISAFVEYTGASVAEIPSIKEAAKDFGQIIQENAPKVIAIVIAGAIALGALAFVSSRLPNLGGIDVKKSVDTAKAGFVSLKNQVQRI